MIRCNSSQILKEFIIQYGARDHELSGFLTTNDNKEVGYRVVSSVSHADDKTYILNGVEYTPTHVLECIVRVNDLDSEIILDYVSVDCCM